MAGIRVYLHFTWFIVAALEITRFAHRYHNPIWAVLEYLALFVIVLMHDLGTPSLAAKPGVRLIQLCFGHLAGLRL
jgi:hypothetical protein